MSLRYFYVFALLAAIGSLSSACTHQKHQNKRSEAGAAIECTTPQMLQSLTYCASPEAAMQAQVQHAVRESIHAGGEENVDWKLLPVPISGSAVDGPEDAAVTLVMFTDLECTFCAHAHQTLKALRKKYPDDLRIVLKHTPLPFHDRAVSAALAAEALR